MPMRIGATTDATIFQGTKIFRGIFDCVVNGKRIQTGTATPTSANEREHRIKTVIKERVIATQAAPDRRATVPGDAFSAERLTLNSLVATWGQKPESQPVQTLFQQIIANAMQIGSLEAQSQAKVLLGKLIYLADMNLQKTALLITPGDLDATETAINNAFNDAVLAVRSYLQVRGDAHAFAGLQTKPLFLAAQTPVEVARALVTSTGNLNLSMGHAFADIVMQNDDAIEYEKDIRRIIDCLSNSLQLQDLFSGISKPDNPSYNSNILIRTALGIAPQTPVSDVHAKQAALAAMMSNLRQGPVGSCFATYLGIEILELRIEKAIRDFGDILKKDELSRTVDGERKDFDYVLNISDDDIRAQYTISPDGVLTRFNKKLSEAPGIQAASRAMGRDDVDAVLKKALPMLISSGRTTKLMPIQIIEAMAKAIDPQRAAQLFEAGKIGFSAETNCPILRAWETCIASMAEARPQSLVRGQILSSVQGALLPQFTTKKSSDRALMQKVQNVFLETLSKNMTVRFDPSIATGGTSGDGHSTEGAFVPYEDSPTVTSSTGTRIDDPLKFRSFVGKQFSLITDAINQGASSKERKKMLDTAAKVQKFVNSDVSFLKNVLANYDRSNRGVDPINGWQQLEHTPWMDKTGDDNREVLDVYFESAQPAPATTYTPRTPQDLLHFMVGFFRDMQAQWHYLDDNTPDQVFPCDTPSHAFSATAEHPSIIPAVRDSGDINAWIARTMITPGIEVGNSPLDTNLRASIVDYAATQLVDPSMTNLIRNSAASIPANNTVRQFRDGLLQVIKTRSNASTSTMAAVAQYLDVFIINNGLNASQKAKISVLHIADTNWNDGDKEIHFCVYPNPCTSTVEFGMIYDDDSELMLADASEWVTNQEWRLFRVGVNDIQT